MNIIQHKELSSLLLEFAGFKQVKDGNFITNLWKYPYGKVSRLPPNLVISLDAQVRYLFPILKALKLHLTFNVEYDDIFNHAPVYAWTIFEGTHSIKGQGEDKDNPAIAFALALKDMLDNNPELLNREAK